MKGLCTSCRSIADQPQASHQPKELRLAKIDYALLGTRDGTGSAVMRRHFVCELCDARWSARAKPDGTCCDWRLD